MAAFMLGSKSTKVSVGQSASLSFSRVTGRLDAQLAGQEPKRLLL